MDTVYGASKREQRATEAPSSVTVIRADEIRKYGYRTLAELLRSVPGFYVNYDRNYHYLGMRGFRRPGDYDTRILLLVDGHRVNENVGDGPAFGTQFLLDIDLIDKVEIIRGPGSSLYGSNAVLGVINVITKTGRDISGLELSGEVGSLSTTKGRVTYGDISTTGWNCLSRERATIAMEDSCFIPSSTIRARQTDSYTTTTTSLTISSPISIGVM